MRPEIVLSLLIEFEELFALRDRLRTVADQVRARLLAAGFPDRLEAELFENELELRGTPPSGVLIRLDSYRLEVTGAPPGLQLHTLAAILLDEAGAFRLTTVEAGFTVAMKAGRGRPLELVALAFAPVAPGSEPMLDRQFSMSWDWGAATTGYSLQVSDTEDRDLFVSFKAREGYMTVPELESGIWIADQAARFDAVAGRLLEQLGWNL
jgi:hypothetical protein